MQKEPSSAARGHLDFQEPVTTADYFTYVLIAWLDALYL
jgi:hypothetical protein